MMDDRNRYWPRDLLLDGPGPDPVSIINEPVHDNVIPLPKARSLHAALCEARINAQSLLNRLELGVRAPPGQAREVIRELYVATRRQLQAFSAVLELDGLE